MDKHLEVAVCLFPNFGKLEKLETSRKMLPLLQPLWVTVLSIEIQQHIPFRFSLFVSGVLAIEFSHESMHLHGVD